MIVDVRGIELSIDAAIPCGLLLNELISNSLKHAFRGKDRGEICILLQPTSGGEVMLSVSDDGVGLPPGVGPQPGETLGMQLIADLVQQMHGSWKSAGTVEPRCKSFSQGAKPALFKGRTSMSAEANLLEGKEAAVGAARILVVEDERIVARSLRKQLTELSYEVVASVPSGGEAIEQARDARPDLVLMDINLEGPMDGVEAAAAIRKQFRLPVIYLTAYSNKEILERAKITEPFGYILKPFEERELHVVIETALYKHRMERRLQEQNRWFAATLKSVGDAVVATDDEGRVTYMNPLAERLTGWAGQEALGRAVQEVVRLVHGDTRQPLEPLLDRVEQEGAAGAGTLLVAKDRTEMEVEVCVSLIDCEMGGVLGRVVVFRDVTWRRHLEEQYRQAQKLGAVGQLAGGVAHEFNNLLTIMNGYCEVMLTSLPANHAHGKMLMEVMKAGSRAVALTNQLLAFGHQQLFAPKELDLNDVVQHSEKMLRRILGEKIRLVTDYVPTVSRVRVDPGQLEQLLINLVSNARDAMPEGGTLTIKTRNRELDAEQCRRYQGGKPGYYFELTVTDTGHGMTPEVQAHIFEPFYTTKDVGKGTGLGLAMVYGIVQQSGGHVAVKSIVGVGTTFEVLLPAVTVRPDASETARGASLPSRGSETVLLVDDEDDVRKLTRLILETYGYKVLEAGNWPAQGHRP